MSGGASPLNEDGVVSAVVVAMLALAGLLCLAVADAANVLVARARAQTAADAAALAAAVAQWPFARDGSRDEGPAQAASRVAEANGAVLESCDCPVRGSSATVTVSISTSIRMLGVAPSRVSARATSALDVGRVFEPP